MKKEKKIAVIGAGISGLTIAKMMSQVEGFSVSVFEESEDVGGIAKVRMVGNFPYHKIGGHCFNSKHPEVLDFVFDNVLEKDEWNLVERKASILFKGTRLDYPIEFSMKRRFSTTLLSGNVTAMNSRVRATISSSNHSPSSIGIMPSKSGLNFVSLICLPTLPS